MTAVEHLAMDVISGLLVFGGLGFMLGLVVAMFSRDGIFPEVWAAFVLFGFVVGAIAGVVASLARLLF
jgi:hypothetical protein